MEVFLFYPVILNTEKRLILITYNRSLEPGCPKESDLDLIASYFKVKGSDLS